MNAVLADEKPTDPSLELELELELDDPTLATLASLAPTVLFDLDVLWPPPWSRWTPSSRDTHGRGAVGGPSGGPWPCA